MPGPGRKFEKGKSGNPGGRPKETGHVRALARVHRADAIKTLAEIMNNPDEKAVARVAAASALLDRDVGRPTQPVKKTVTHQRSVRDMSLEELERFLAKAPIEPH